MLFCILLGSRILLPLIAPPEYSSAYLVILLLLPGTAFIGIYYFGETILNAVQKTHILGLTMTMCAIISVILNYMLIPVMNWYGSVIALNVSYFLVSLTLSIIGMKKFPFPVEWKRICITGGLIIFFFLLFFIVRDFNLILFNVITMLTAFAIISMLFKIRFFHSDEIIAIKSLIP